MRAAGAKKPAIRGGLKSGRKRRNAGKGNPKVIRPRDVWRISHCNRESPLHEPESAGGVRSQ